MMQKFVVDISAYSAFQRGDKRLSPYFAAPNNLLVPLIVVGELRAGFAAGSLQRDNEARLQRFVESPRVEIGLLTDATTELYATIYARLRAAGTPINTNDMWIAALALELDLQLLTLDSDFDRIPDLMVVDLSF